MFYFDKLNGTIINMFFLKILEKLGRKRVVMDRGPSHPEYHLAKPWTERYYLLLIKIQNSLSL